MGVFIKTNRKQRCKDGDAYWIMYLGMSYIERRYITQDEYENLKVYLFEPYEKLGGNGSAKRIMQEVDKLPIHKFIQNKEDEHDEHDET